jgi:hypothetical protein
MSSAIGVPEEFWLAGTHAGRMSQRKRELLYPGLTEQRRVVLDLTFHGHGASAGIVDTNGELLAIGLPGAKYDPVPGAHVVELPLGIGLQKLVDAGARFDLIVSEVPHFATTPRIGAFGDPRPPLNKTGRRLILPGVVVKKPEVRETDLALASFRATQKLLSPNGEALLRMHVSALNDILKMEEPGVDKVWYCHVNRDQAELYLYNKHVGDWSPSIRERKPTAMDRVGHLHHFTAPYTKGQRDLFLKTLKK